MKKAILCILVLATSAFAAEIDKAQLDVFKKESGALRAAIDDIVNTTVSGRGADSTKAAYLDGYGAIFTLEASLEPTRSPFSSPKTAADIRAIVTERRKAIETKLEALMKERAGAMQSVSPTESVTIILFLFNSNPVDVPDLPSQIQFTVKKDDPTQVIVQAY
jgi:hypothetical protein